MNATYTRMRFSAALAWTVLSLAHADDCRDFDVRLTDGQRNRRSVEGVPELFINGSFHPICAPCFWNDDNGAKLFCKKLGYQSGKAYSDSAPKYPYSLSSGDFTDAVYIGQCSPEDPDLRSCSKSCPPPGEGCTRLSLGGCDECRADRIQGIGIRWLVCEGKPDKMSSCSSTTTTTTIVCPELSVRLTNARARAGTVTGIPKVFKNFTFHPIRERCFEENGARLFCQELGFKGGSTTSTYNLRPLKDGIFVGRCSAKDPNFASCSGLCTDGTCERWSQGGECGSLGITVTCSGNSSVLSSCVPPAPTAIESSLLTHPNPSLEDEESSDGPGIIVNKASPALVV